MFSNELMLGGAKSASGGIGVAGEQGFGVGVYPGDDEDLVAMGLSPMEGCDDPASDNYGNYIHTNGSVMCFVPAFCYRIGQPTAPSYERDGANALEIGSPELDGSDNWILHRAFIDGGEIKSGFFFDKYMNSKSSSNSNIAVSVKNGDPISLYDNYNPSSTMTGCVGYILDAITLSRARGDAYSCATIFQWSAISMLSLAHGQAATSSEFCAWYDSDHSINFPKGANNRQTDTDDSSVKFTAASYASSFSKTGSGVPFEKTTHNGQANGVCDLSGNKYQALIGGNARYVYKESLAVHAITTSNYGTSSNYDDIGGTYVGSYSTNWGRGTAQAFFTESSGYGRALCGVYAKSGATGGTALFGYDYHYMTESLSNAVFASGYFDFGIQAGVFYRYFGSWTYGDNYCGFRAAAYAS